MKIEELRRAIRNDIITINGENKKDSTIKTQIDKEQLIKDYQIFISKWKKLLNAYENKDTFTDKMINEVQEDITIKKLKPEVVDLIIDTVFNDEKLTKQNIYELQKYLESLYGGYIDVYLWLRQALNAMNKLFAWRFKRYRKTLMYKVGNRDLKYIPNVGDKVNVEYVGTNRYYKDLNFTNIVTEVDKENKLIKFKNNKTISIKHIADWIFIKE